jgi:hypothetical protein
MGREREGCKEQGVSGEYKGGLFFLCALSLGGVLPSNSHKGGKPTFVFVMVNDAQTCFATSVKFPFFHILRGGYSPPPGGSFMESISFKSLPFILPLEKSSFIGHCESFKS